MRTGTDWNDFCVKNSLRNSYFRSSLDSFPSSFSLKLFVSQWIISNYDHLISDTLSLFFLQPTRLENKLIYMYSNQWVVYNYINYHITKYLGLKNIFNYFTFNLLWGRKYTYILRCDQTERYNFPYHDSLSIESQYTTQNNYQNTSNLSS